MAIRRGRKSRWYQLDGEKAFWLFAIFAALVFLTGGGSRADIESLGPLRTLSALVLAVALWFQSGKSLRRVITPLCIILLLAAWMAIQLVPLPPSIWAGLPGREVISELGMLAGLESTWRPITFSPMKTANSLASLVVPLAGLLVLALLDERGWRRLPWVFIVAGVASALFGVAQLLTGVDGLYLYEITNDGSAVGLFSNRNHNAMFLTAALLLCVFRMERISRKQFGPAEIAAILAALAIFVGILVNASRSGLVGLGLVGLIFAARALLAWRSGKANGGLRLIISAIVGLLSLSLVALFAFLGRSPAIERLIQSDPAEGQRAQTLDTVLGMVTQFQPFGTGFGAFEQAFRTLESDDLLSARYFNNAHNDWLQFPIEGGLPAILLGLVAIVLLVLRTLRIVRNRPSDQMMADNAVLGILVIGVLALASIVDYPLRTPSIMLLVVAAAAMLFKPMATAARG